MNFIQKFSKKAVFLYVILAFLFSVSVKKAEATCSTGWSSSSIMYSYNYGGGTCNITVTYCFTCGSANNGTPSIYPTNISVDNTCVANVNFDSNFYEDLKTQLSKELTKNCNENPPPCSESTRISHEVRVAQCWKFYHTNIGVGQDYWINYLDPCGEAYCVTIFKICTDYATQGHPIVIQTYEQFLVGDSQCSSSYPLIPPTGFTWSQNFSTYCFTASCQQIP